MTDHCAPASDNAAATRHDGLDRRTLLTGAASALVAAAAAVAHAAPAEAAQAPAPATASGPLVVVTDRGPVVETTGGRVRGARMRDIHTFKGIPYGASTAGTGRFMPPVKVTPWTGVRSALHYGPVAPHGPRAGWAFDEEAFMFEWDDGVPSEDCLRMNVWTPGLDAKKRPVMVWIHGGGFAAGSSQELRAYDGERLARRGDVVVVSMNHRLNVLGYANLAAYGSQYASAGLAGMLDLVLALEWVRDNIANFGGDPGSVTIFGQSGGGSKVSTLMAMPAAKGLFHRAAVHSASSLRMNSADTSAKVAAAMLAELGLPASQVGTLQTMPFERLFGAAMAGLRKIVPADPAPIRRVANTDRAEFAPVVDGRLLPAQPFDPVAPAISSHIPLLIGCCFNEFGHGINHPEWERSTEQDVRARVTQSYGAKGDAVYDAYKALYPRMTPFDLQSQIAAALHRQNAVMQTERHVALKGAPAWHFMFKWQTPILDGRPRAFHCAELPFVFDNTDRCAAMTGGTAEARALAAKVADAWIAFARTGNPNHAGLPAWPAFEAARGPMMVFDNTCEVQDDYDRRARQVFAGV